FPEAKTLAPEDLPSHMFPRLFATVAAPAMLDDLVPIAEQFKPEVIVHEVAELAAPIVAALHDVPHVSQAFGSPVPAERLAAAAEFIAALWQHFDLNVPPYAGVFDHLYLDIYPQSLHFSEDTHVRNDQPMRPVIYAPPFADAGAWQPD